MSLWDDIGHFLSTAGHDVAGVFSGGQPQQPQVQARPVPTTPQPNPQLIQQAQQANLAHQQQQNQMNQAGMAQAAQPHKSPGFIGDVENFAKGTVQGIVNPVAKVGNDVGALVKNTQALGQLATGNKQGSFQSQRVANRLLAPGGGLLHQGGVGGQVSGKSGLTGKQIRAGIGTGAQIGSNIAAGGAGLGEKALGSQIAKGALQGAAINTVGGAGQQLAQGKFNAKQLAENAAAGAVLGGGVPLAKSGIENARPLNEVGGIPSPAGKSPKIPTTDQNIKPVGTQAGKGSEERISKWVNKASENKIMQAPDFQNSVTNTDRMLANQYKVTPEQVAARRLGHELSIDGGRSAQESLRNGGSRADATKAYQQVTGESEKMAKYKVSLISRQSKLALHPNETGTNPLEGKLDVEMPKDGDYRQVQLNRNKTVGTIDRAKQSALSFRNQLSDNDRLNIRHYVEGTEDINKADNPGLVNQAVTAIKHLTDTVHAIDPATVRYIQKFFPEYWDRTDPKMIAKMRLQAAQDVEEQVGPDAWRKMSLEDRELHTNNRIAEMQADQVHPQAGDEANYGGYHNKPRTFANAKEGEAANFTHAHEDPFDDLERYANGASLNIGNEITKRSARAAGLSSGGLGAKLKTIDLPGGDSMKVPIKGYRRLQSLDTKDRGPVQRAWNGLTSAVTQFIVMNPAIHGANLYAQGFREAGKQPLFPTAEGLFGKIPSGPVGGVRFTGNSVRLLFDRNARAGATTKYLSDGGHIPTYGKDYHSVISTAFDKAHLPEVNKLNERAMSKIDELFRVSRHDENLRAGVNPTESVKSIDDFMGDQKHVNAIAQNTGLFYHWLRTEGNALSLSVTHPIKNAGATVNIAVLLAGMYGLNKAWQAATGNKNANIRIPGDVGLVNDAANAIKQHSGQPVVNIATSHINPILTAGINQLAGENTYTGQKLSGAKARGQDALNTLVAPASGVTRVMSGKRSIPEQVAYQFGIKVPHAAGNPAVPNNNFLKVLNASGSKPAAGADKTGYQQQQQWFTGKAKSLQGASAHDSDVLNQYYDTQVNSQGQKVKNGVVGGYANANNLVTNDDKGGQALKRLYTNEHNQPNNDPLWKLPLYAPNGKASVKNYLNIQNKLEGSEKDGAITGAQGSVSKGWYTDLEKTRTAFFNKLPASKDVSAEPAYPVSKDPQVVADMKTANGISDSTQFSQFLNTHQDVTDQFAQIANWTNQIRGLEGGKPLPEMQQNPQMQQLIKTYDALPLSKSAGNTDPNTNKARSNWIKANPQAYQQMATFLSQSSLVSLLKNSIQAVYSGQGINSQAVLKDTKNAAQDIAKGTNGQYSVNPAAASAAAYGSSSSSSSSSGGYPVGGKLDINMPRYKLKVSSPRRLKLQASRDYLKGAKIKAKPYKAGQKAYSSAGIGQY